MIHNARHKPDMILIVLTGMILLIGLAVLTSASAVISQKHFGQTTYYITHQLLYGLGIGIVCFIAASSIPYTFWERAAIPLMIVSLFLLFIVFLPQFGVKIGGAQRWIRISHYSFQPSEFAKLAFLFYLAAWFAGRSAHIRKFSYGFLPFLIMVICISVLLGSQPDIGTLAVILLIAISQYFIAGGKIRHITTLGIILAAGLAFIVYLQPYQQDRIRTFLDPENDPLGIGYQIKQSLIAIGSGGISGKGLGHGVQKYEYLPEAMGDSIFSTLGEEFGFIGAASLVILFTLWAYRGIRIALHSKALFPKLTAVGITMWIFGQTFIHIGALTGIMPLTGIPLPFVSYGGTSLISILSATGVLINISAYTS